MNEFASLTDSLGNFLLDSAVHTVVIVPLILAIQWFLRNHLSPTAKHALWLLVLLRLTFPSFPESRLSVFKWIPQHYEAQPAQHDARTSISQPSNIEAIAPRGKTSLSATVNQADNTQPERTDPPIAPETDLSLGIAFPKIKPAQLEDLTTVTAKPKSREPFPTMGSAFIVVWLGGFSLLLTRIVCRWVRFHRRLTCSAQKASPKLRQTVRRLQRELGYSRNVDVWLTNLIGSPAIYCFFRPKLLLPQSLLSDYSEDELRHILAHEIAHLRRLDPLWNLWTTLIQLIHWPNPIVWYALGRIRGDRELATDYLALRTLSPTEGSEYGKTILKTLQAISGPRMIPTLVGIAEDRRSLQRRFQMISQYQSSKTYSPSLLVTLLFCLTLTGLTDASMPSIAPIQTEKTSRLSVPDQPGKETVVEENKFVRITVQDLITKQPIPHATILAKQSNWDGFKRTGTVEERMVTDILGERSFHPIKKDPDTTTFVVKAKGYATIVKRYFTTYPVPETLTIQLERSRSISGQVKDTGSDPVPNVNVMVRYAARKHNHSPGPSDPAPAITDENGRWTFNDLPASADLAIIEFHHPFLALSSAQFPPNKENRIRGNQLEVAIDSNSKTVPTVELTAGGRLYGQALGPDNRPIVQASVNLIHNSSISIKTDAQGRFEFPGSLAGEFEFTVEARGFAPQLVPIHISPNTSSQTITMPIGNQIQLFIQDPEGARIADAGVMATYWSKTGTPLGNIQGTSDQSGLYTFDSAPTDPLRFVVHKAGFEMKITPEMTPQSAPYPIVLQPTLQVHFDIRDVQNRPIREFNVVPGFPALLPHDPVAVEWYPKYARMVRSQRFPFSARKIPSFAPGPNDTGYVFRIEAHGYLPEVTDVIEFRRNPVTATLQLQPFHGLKGSLLSSKNLPLAFEHVRLLGVNDRVTLLEGEPARVIQSGQRVRTDANGRFQAPSSAETTTLLAMLPSGFVLKTLDTADVNEPQTLQLEPWGKIHGRLLSNQRPAAHRILSFRRLQENASHLDVINIVDRATTDLNGQFEFDHVPPGDIEIIEIHHPSGEINRDFVLTSFRQVAGKTTTLTIERANDTF